MLTRRHLLRGVVAGTAAFPMLSGMSHAAGLGTDYDVIVIGAGVAGLTAAGRLLEQNADLKVLILEARERIGGRVYSLPHDDLRRHADLGAWYVQHDAGESWDVLNRLGLDALPVGENLSLLPGMSALTDALARPLEGKVQLNSLVSEVFWRQGIVGVNYGNRGLTSAVTARRLVITVPTAVLRDSGLALTPALPAEKREALDATQSRPAVSISLVIANRPELLGESAERLQSSGALQLRAFRTGQNGEVLLEAQFSDARAQALMGQPQALVETLALRAFADMLQAPLSREDVAWSHFADWTSDTLSRGAGPIATAEQTHRILAQSVEDTLFFAGDATVSASMVGTVHGAYASGERVAEEVGRSLRAEDAGLADPNEPILELL